MAAPATLHQPLRARHKIATVTLRTAIVGPLAVALLLAVATEATGATAQSPRCDQQWRYPRLHTSWPPARRRVLPPGASAVRICRYLGLNTRHPGGLGQSVVITRPREIQRLAGELNHLRLGSLGAKCPADDASIIIILASYPHQRTLTIQVDLRGCNDVSNGSAPGGFRRYIASMKLLKHLAELTDYHGYF
jgi:hypothetical protein